jgi:hypothetical protein
MVSFINYKHMIIKEKNHVTFLFQKKFHYPCNFNFPNPAIDKR